MATIHRHLANNLEQIIEVDKEVSFLLQFQYLFLTINLLFQSEEIRKLHGVLQRLSLVREGYELFA